MRGGTCKASDEKYSRGTLDLVDHNVPGTAGSKCMNKEKCVFGKDTQMKSIWSAFGFTALGTLMLLSVELKAQDSTATPETAPGGSVAVVETQEESNLPTLSATVNYASAYIYNGFIWNSGNVLQPEISLDWKGFFAGAWATWDCMDDNGEQDNDFEEWNYYAGYGHTFADVPALGALSLEGTYTYYDFPGFPESDYQEISFKATLDDVLLQPSLTVAWEFEDDTYWASLGASHSVALTAISEKLSLDMEGELFWNNAKYNWWTYGVDKNALAALQIKAGLNYAVCDYCSFGPFVICAWALDHDLREVWKDDAMNSAFNVLWGFALNAEF